MFSSVGWGEILVLLVVGIVVVGPERLPRIIEDVKAMVRAARNAISSAKEEMGDDFKEDFEDFRKPLAQLNDVRRMGARGLVSRALLEDDPDFLRELRDTATGVTGAVSGRSRTDRAQGTQGARGTAASQDATAAQQVPDATAPQTQQQTPAGGAAVPGAPAPAQDHAADWGNLDDGDVL